MTDTHVRKGAQFTHPKLLDPTWKPQPGQRYSRDAPKARCEVMAVRAETVYYRYLGTTGPAAFRATLASLAGAIQAG